MPDSHTYVDGDALVTFILEVRRAFLAERPPVEADEHGPNSIHLVAIDAFEARCTDDQLAIIKDLLAANSALIVSRRDEDMFQFSDTPAAYLTDLVCEVAYQILARDPSIAAEHHRRLAPSHDGAQ